MSLQLVAKLIDEITSSKFPWEVKTIQVGENGDALFHPQLLLILRLIKEKAPSIKVNLATNMINMNMGLSKAILKEGLLSSLQLNIDGHDKETYEAQKKLSYKKVMENLKTFMRMRSEINPNFSIGINVLTLSQYYDHTMKRFGQPPLRSPDLVPFSNYKKVYDSLREKEWISSDVHIRKSPTFFWAEREMDIQFPDLSSYQCPQLPRIENEAFISPRGHWYACCLDANQDLVLGNIWKQTLIEIYESKERKNFIQNLKDKKFENIGYPCDRVPFCGVMA